MCLGVPPEEEPGYNLINNHAFECFHLEGVLDRGTRLSPPVPFCVALARARQPLWQRLIFTPPLVVSGHQLLASSL